MGQCFQEGQLSDQLTLKTSLKDTPHGSPDEPRAGGEAAGLYQQRADCPRSRAGKLGSNLGEWVVCLVGGPCCAK